MSGTTVIPEVDPALFHNYRNETLSFAEFQHTGHGISVRQDIEILERGILARVVLTGL